MGRTMSSFSFSTSYRPDNIQLEAELKSIIRKIEIWKAFDEPRVYPDFSNLSEPFQKTIISLAPLNPVYFGSTVFCLYGLTKKKPVDLDIIFRTKKERDTFIRSKLITKAQKEDRDYHGNVISQTCYCKSTGIELDLVVDDFSEVIYTRNMCTLPVKDLTQMLVDICTSKYDNKRYTQLREITEIMDLK